jgi:hypothetical protein
MNAKFCMAGSVNTSRRRILMHPSLIYNRDIQPGYTAGIYSWDIQQVYTIEIYNQWR